MQNIKQKVFFTNSRLSRVGVTAFQDLQSAAKIVFHADTNSPTNNLCYISATGGCHR